MLDLANFPAREMSNGGWAGHSQWIWKHNWKNSWVVLLQRVFPFNPTSQMKPTLCFGAAVEVTASVYMGMSVSSWAHVLPWSAIKHCTSACRPSTTLHIIPIQAAGVSDTSPTPRNAHVQPAWYTSDKSSQGPSKSWEDKYVWLFGLVFFFLRKFLLES